jgi:hypothetical protein
LREDFFTAEGTEKEKRGFIFGIIWSALALVMHWNAVPRVYLSW